MMKTFMCKIGIHNWKYYNFKQFDRLFNSKKIGEIELPLKRQCNHCNKEQNYYMESGWYNK